MLLVQDVWAGVDVYCSKVKEIEMDTLESDQICNTFADNLTFTIKVLCPVLVYNAYYIFFKDVKGDYPWDYLA